MLSIIIPSKSRAEKLARNIPRIFETTQDHEVEVIVVAYPEPESLMVLTGLQNKYFPLLKVIPSELKAMPAWNLGASYAKGEYIHASADDIWYSDNWLTYVMEVFHNADRKDLYVRIPSESKCAWAELAVGHKSFFIKHMGGVLMVPHYIANWVDVESSDRARNAGVFLQADKSFASHTALGYHPGGVVEQDAETYRNRLLNNFPNDYEPIWTE